MRDNVATKKVYFIEHGKSTEEVLYDFTLEVGDTIRGYHVDYHYPRATVKAIDSVLIGNEYHKRLLLSDVYNIYWIEGVGSTYGLTEGVTNNVDAMGYQLLCFGNTEESSYPQQGGPCAMITGIEDTRDSSPIILSPNPSNSNFTVDFGTNLFKKLTVTDLSGRQIIEINQAFNNRVQVNGLPAGSYFILTEDQQGILGMLKAVVN